MHYFLESAQLTYCRNVVQAYHSEKKRVVLIVPVYVKRNNFCGKLVLQIKNVDGKLFSGMSNNQAYQAISGESDTDFVIYLIIDEKRWIY